MPIRRFKPTLGHSASGAPPVPPPPSLPVQPHVTAIDKSAASDSPKSPPKSVLLENTTSDIGGGLLLPAANTSSHAVETSAQTSEKKPSVIRPSHLLPKTTPQLSNHDNRQEPLPIAGPVSPVFDLPKSQIEYRASSPTPSQITTSSVSSSTWGRATKRTKQRLNIELPENKDDIVVEKLKMRDFLVFNPDGSPMKWRLQEEQIKARMKSQQQDIPGTDLNDKKDIVKEDPNVANRKRSASPIKVCLGEGGEAVVNEESLVIDTTGPRIEPSAATIASAVHEEAESTTTYTTYANYRRKGRCRGRRWGKEETARFFVALRCCGLDFSMISKFFPERDERELRNKYKAEDRRDPDAVTKFLSGANNDQSYDPLALLATANGIFGEKEEKRRKISQDGPKLKRGKPCLAVGEDSVDSNSDEDGESSNDATTSNVM